MLLLLAVILAGRTRTDTCGGERGGSRDVVVVVVAVVVPAASESTLVRAGYLASL